MSRRTLSPILIAFLGLSPIAHTGCTGKQTHRLLPHAQDFRNVAPAPDAPRELARTLHPAHLVEPGDVLLIQPTDLDSPVRICADQPVLADGTVDLGQYGRPVVADKTVPVIEAEITEMVRAKVPDGGKITLNVRLIQRNSKVYYVLGEVTNPGAFHVTGRETALDAIIAAGGLTCDASENNIILSRPTGPCDKRDVKPICYRQIVQLGDTTTNYQIMPGDRIYVPSRSWKEHLCPDGCCFHKTCSPCDSWQVLKPMDRPGCATECAPATCAPEKCASLPKLKLPHACKTDECKKPGLGCLNWGMTGCSLTRGKSCPPPCEMEPGKLYDGVMIVGSSEKPASVCDRPPIPTVSKPICDAPVPLPAVDPSKPLPAIPLSMPEGPKPPTKPEK